jgi:amino acid transporter
MSHKKIGFNGTWSMAVGGMIGGGIFSVLGLIIQTAGQWAWLSFIVAGAIGLISAYSYSQLAIKFSEGGGAFTYLRAMDRDGFAGGLAWILIIGYILSLSVYGFTFGHYISHAVSWEPWTTKLMSLAIISILTLINLKGVQDSSGVEIVIVWGKLIVLIGLAIFGLFHWDTQKLVEGIQPKGIDNSIIGAATIFIAYQGFQLLSYDYKDMQNPQVTLPKATLTAVLAVIVIYIIVTLGATMLVGAETMIKQKEVALSLAGKAAFGKPGLILLTIAAAFSTASAINATLFSTSRLMDDIAEKNSLPEKFAKKNKNKIPYVGLLTIGISSTVLAMFGSLSSLVSSTSLIFLFAFGVVNLVAYKESVRRSWLCLFGAIGSGIAILLESWSLIQKSPDAMILLGVMILLAVFGRKYVLKWTK